MDEKTAHEMLKELRAIRGLLQAQASEAKVSRRVQDSDPFANIAGLTDEQRGRMTASFAKRGVSVL